jgi:hypothetical protein
LASQIFGGATLGLNQTCPKSAPRFAPAIDLIGFCLLLNPLNFFGFIGILDLLGEAKRNQPSSSVMRTDAAQQWYASSNLLLLEFILHSISTCLLQYWLSLNLPSVTL